MRMRTRANPRLVNEIGINPPSKLPLHRPLHGFTSTEVTASFGDNRLNPEAVPKYDSQDSNATDQPDCC
eukprot:1051734-Pyramimonas_sp.AAC.1